MSKTTNRSNCPDCGSSNNLSAWTYNGKQYSKCMTPNCLYNQKVKPIKADLSCNTFNSENITEQTEFLTGEFKATRGLTLETCKAFGIMCQEDRHIFQYNNAQKIRIPKANNKKDMYWQGNHDEAGLFGEHLKYDEKKPIVITEGEFDAASCYQVGYQAYSIKDGAGERKTAQEIKSTLQRITKFSEIIFWFDSDNAGQVALNEVLELDDLPLEKVKIVKSSFIKDANDALTEDGRFISELIVGAVEYIPEGIQRGNQIDFSILEEVEEPGLPFEYEKLQACYHGLRKGEILLIGAGSGAGKSLFAKHLAIYWMKHVPELRIANIFLEEKQKFTLQSFLGLFLNKPAHQLVEMPYAGLKEEGRKLLGSNKYYFDNHFGSLQSKKLFQKLRYLAKKTDVIILDHISIIVSGMESKEGERKDLDRLMTTLKTIAIETGVRFVIISHLRRANGDATYEQGMPITSNSFRGSHSLYQLSDSVVGLERNQQDDLSKNKVKIRGLKNRFKGDVGLLDELYFNQDTGRLKTIDQVFNDE